MSDVAESGGVASQNVPECPTRKKREGLTERQWHAAALLGSGTTEQAAADAVGVDRRTIYRWRTTSRLFAQEVAAHQRLAWERSAERLRQMIQPALDILERQMQDPKTALRAAAILLRQAAPRASNLAPPDPTDVQGMFRRMENETALLSAHASAMDQDQDTVDEDQQNEEDESQTCAHSPVSPVAGSVPGAVSSRLGEPGEHEASARIAVQRLRGSAKISGMNRSAVSSILISLLLLLPGLLRADDKVLADTTQAIVDKGLAFLKSQQKPDGSWQNEKEPPAITALALRTFVQDAKYNSKTDFVKKGLDALLAQQVEDGGIYKNLMANYNTAIVISTLAAAKDDSLKPAIDKAVAYLKKLQWTGDTVSAEGESLSSPEDGWFGGWGYGGRSRGKGRPDLSNTQLALEALHDAGVPKDDPAYQNALKFVTRLQNHSESNEQDWVGNDGGFIYGPSDDRKGESFAGTYEENGQRRLRSYGAMTYAGLKSFLYAGLSKDDPRVQATFTWITQNWTLDENPGMRLAGEEKSKAGLFYYYHTLGRAMNEFGQNEIVDPNGNKHDWRAEFVEKMASLQNADGSWTGDKKYMEDNAVLATAYVVLALQEAQKSLK